MFYTPSKLSTFSLNPLDRAVSAPHTENWGSRDDFRPDNESLHLYERNQSTLQIVPQNSEMQALYSERASCLTWESSGAETRTQKSVPASVQISINRKTREKQNFPTQEAAFLPRREKLKRVRITGQKLPSDPVLFSCLWCLMLRECIGNALPFLLRCFK